MNTSLVELRDRHPGESVFIICNGPSADDVMDRLSDAWGCATVFGINRSWRYVNTDFDFANDIDHIEAMRIDPYRPVSLVVPDSHLELAKDVDPELLFSFQPMNVERERRPVIGFSRNIATGVYVRTTPYVALQFAVYMGFTRIFFVGLDLEPHGERHYAYGDEGTISSSLEAASREAFGYAAGLLDGGPVQVFNCNPRSRLQAFPRISFDRALELAH